MVEKKLTWLRDLITLGGALTGIIMTAIGGVLVLNAVLKLYVFQFQTAEYSIVTTEECRMDYSRMKESEPTVRTPEEIEQCKTDRQEENLLRFERQKKENLVDGLAMLLVGIPFWMIFWRRRKL
ncbi:hypothetical protein HN954_01325 [bacterium]|jgi:hypothetical protein|nr:hypothetical protein [bacterium]MBT6831499.1 hypothetical protein [bacterium]MBT6996053.1 hypothetical protein [bacterium]MBT7772174.1 hypothetical protein [bacterium]